MCGITGVIGRQMDRAHFLRMTDLLSYRGPDDGGIFMKKDVSLGHRRLSIIDLSSAGRQPMVFEKKQLILVFNGEIYNYPELREELKEEYAFVTKTDTEVILAAYVKWGEECVTKFNGMFAFALWDNKNNKLFCSRDRLGVKPFYYFFDGSTLVFASEIKSILASGLVKPAADEYAIYEYFFHGRYHHSSRTFFKDIASLSPGTSLIFHKHSGTMELKSYWDIPKENEELQRIPFDEAKEKFLSLLTESVKYRLRSDVPIGLHLSGGLDSSVLLLLFDELLETPAALNAYTVVFNDPKYDEAIHVEELKARRHPWRFHTAGFSSASFWDDAEKLLYHMEAPYGGLATIAYFGLNRMERGNNVKVLLEGQGGDEILAGYEYYKSFLSCNPQPRNENLYQDGTSFLRADLLNPEFTGRFSDTSWVCPKPFSSALRNMQYRDLRFTKLPRVLCFNDRATMAFGKELRVPFLDYRVVEFCMLLPDQYKISDSQTKYLMREAFKSRLPEKIRNASKRAVVNPQHEWFRGCLRREMEEIFTSSSFRERPFWNAKKIFRAFRIFCDSPEGNSIYLWQYVNLELWFRMFMDSSAWMKNPPSPGIPSKDLSEAVSF